MVGAGIFLIATMSRAALQPPSPPALYQMGTRGSFPGVKQLGHESHHPSQPVAKFKNA